MSLTTVGILFGGQSGEHEVSLMSVQSVLAALDRQRYQPVLMGIDKQGRWLYERPLQRLLAGESAPAGTPRWPDPTRLANIDIIFPVLHGTYGEDGVVQGFLELANLPYVGAGVLASALAMDKSVSKQVFAAQGLPQTPWQTVSRAQVQATPEAVLAQLEARLAYPMFTKPANLGSSVGISKAHNRQELLAGLQEAAEYDIIIVVEQAVLHVREIEVSVMGNDHLQTSIPGEVIPSNEFYDYTAKYHSQDSQTLIPAPISPELTAQVQTMAQQAFRAIQGSGLARVDFLLDDASGQLYLNEVNTMPGFTQISMFPKLWTASGLAYPDLLHQLIQLGFQRYQQRNSLRTTHLPHSPNP